VPVQIIISTLTLLRYIPTHHQMNAPQQNKAPLLFRPHVWEEPALTVDQGPSTATATGTALFVMLSSPSCPFPLYPAWGC
jgi:hypothetical protein